MDSPHHERSLFRLLDANANRAAEALRVLEDYARFLRDDAEAARGLKDLRHEVQAARAALDPGGRRLLAARDTAADVGRALAPPGPPGRADAAAVAGAAAARAQQALRALEEYAKVLSLPAAAVFERARYLVYEWEKRLLEATTPARAPRLQRARLYALYDLAVCGLGDPAPRAAAWRAGGVEIVQLRAKALPDAAVLPVARALRAALSAPPGGPLFFVNDRPDLALLVEADGVHLGGEDLPIAEARRLLAPAMLIGRSAHTLAQAREAVAQGADLLGVGPAFATATKPHEPRRGLVFLRAVARERLPVPCFALGGIDRTNLRRVLATGLTRVAVCGALAGAEPAAAARALRGVLDRAPPARSRRSRRGARLRVRQ